jgi:hypothetical protein
LGDLAEEMVNPPIANSYHNCRDMRNMQKQSVMRGLWRALWSEFRGAPSPLLSSGRFFVSSYARVAHENVFLCFPFRWIQNDGGLVQQGLHVSERLAPWTKSASS